ncbi:hypothetical protein ACFLWX_04315 [Chloroflexota bacterium]
MEGLLTGTAIFCGRLAMQCEVGSVCIVSVEKNNKQRQTRRKEALPKVYQVDMAPLGGNAQRRLSFSGGVNGEEELWLDLQAIERLIQNTIIADKSKKKRRSYYRTGSQGVCTYIKTR